MVATRWWALGTVLEPVEPLLSEAMSPQPCRPFRHTHLLGDERIGLPVGDAQNDLGPLRRSLSRVRAGHPPLQLSALSGHQPDSSSTLLGHMQTCQWSFPFQPARLSVNSQPASINRTRY